VYVTDVATQSLRETLRVVRRDELVLAGIAIIVLIGLVGGGVNLLVPLQLKSNGVSAAEIGLLFSAASAVYTVVSAVVARLGEAVGDAPGRRGLRAPHGNDDRPRADQPVDGRGDRVRASACPSLVDDGHHHLSTRRGRARTGRRSGAGR
jgi:hypothetical protein